MVEFRIGDAVYRTQLLNAAEQWHLLQRLMPILPALSGMDYGLRLPGVGIDAVLATMTPLLSASDEDTSFIFDTCRSACEVRAGDVWVPVDSNLPFSDLLHLVMQAVAANFGPLFAMERPKFHPERDPDAVEYEPVRMPQGKDWLLRPVMEHLCRAESLRDGSLRIEHVAELNDAIDVQNENHVRARVAAKRMR